jgi:hypothetical protein
MHRLLSGRRDALGRANRTPKLLLQSLTISRLLKLRSFCFFLPIKSLIYSKFFGCRDAFGRGGLEFRITALEAYRLQTCQAIELFRFPKVMFLLY